MQSVFVFGLFALLLVYKWQFASYDDFIIGGLLPLSDASGYLQEAQRILNGSLLTAFGARRRFSPLSWLFYYNSPAGTLWYRLPYSRG